MLVASVFGRSVRLAIAAVAMAGAFALSGGTVSAQEAAAPPAPQPAPVRVSPGANANPQPWTVNCTSQPPNGALVCTLTQVLIAADTRQRVIGATVFKPQPSANPVLRLSLPHGILLQQGVEVAIDQQPPVKHLITIADQNGSYSDIPLAPEAVTALQQGTTLHVGVAAANGERIDFQLSLKGFTAAFGKL